ncbi:MAG: phosphotransferase [Myxococcales bacterium]|nr:phosphotransferase [Myxococcales bacterium]
MNHQAVEQEELADLCHRALAEGKVAEVESISALTGGGESYVYRADVVFADGQRDSLVLRSCQRGLARARLELSALQHVVAHGFGAPTPISLVPAGPRGLPWLVLGYVEGRLLTDVMRDCSDQLERAPWLGRLGRHMAALHALPFEPLADAPDPPLVSKYPKALLLARLQTMREGFERFGQTELIAVVDWAQKRIEAADAMGPAIVHYDVHPNNVIVDGDDRLHLLDWSVVHVGDPRFDVAMACAILGAHGGAALASMLVAEYERCHGAQLQDLGVFEALVGATNLLRFLLAMPAEPLSDEARAALPQFARPRQRRRALSRYLPTVGYFHDLITRSSGIRVAAAEELLRRAGAGS